MAHRGDTRDVTHRGDTLRGGTHRDGTSQGCAQRTEATRCPSVTPCRRPAAVPVRPGSLPGASWDSQQIPWGHLIPGTPAPSAAGAAQGFSMVQGAKVH